MKYSLKKLLRIAIKKRKKILKELISIRIQKCKSEIKFYKYIQKMDEKRKIYIPPFISLNELINSCEQEIERMLHYEKQF